MLAKIFFLFVTVNTHSVLCGYYPGNTALPYVQHNGYLADTYEVAAAKSAHLAALSGQSHGHHGNTHGAWRYHAPSAIPHVQHDGYLSDTHEVAAAKSTHLAALSGQSHGHHKETHGAWRYHATSAIPHVLHDGHIADTHEVAAAKAEHFAAVAKARTHGGYHHDSRASGAHHGNGAQTGYNGPLANPLVLPSGYLADTHEVAQAKEHHLHLLKIFDHKNCSHHNC